MKNVTKPLRHSDSAAKQNNFTTCVVRSADGFFHLFDAAVKFLTRLAFNKEGGTGRAKFFEVQSPVPLRNGAQIVGSNKNLARWKRHSSHVLRLLEALFESSEKFLACLVEKFRCV